MSQPDQHVLDRGERAGSAAGGSHGPLAPERGAEPRDGGAAEGERLARGSLRQQIARLERELSQIVAGTFPHLCPPLDPTVELPGWSGPALPSLAQLERTRDQLAARVQDADRLRRRRADHERRAREQLRRMKLEPGRYKFVRLPVSDLGEGGCGVWEVRPRLGLIGMLAGWWQLKLSSGCPLPRGPRPRRGPASPAAASRRA